MRVVFDTNVLLAAFLTDGVCAKLLRRANQRLFDLCLCPVILAEFKHVLVAKFKATRAEAADAIALLREAAHSVITPQKLVQASRDPDDDAILACAHAAGADFLVTGDGDLLELKKFEGITIIRPADFERMIVE